MVALVEKAKAGQIVVDNIKLVDRLDSAQLAAGTASIVQPYAAAPFEGSYIPNVVDVLFFSIHGGKVIGPLDTRYVVICKDSVG